MKKNKKNISLSIAQLVTIVLTSIILTAGITFAGFVLQSKFTTNALTTATHLPQRLLSGLSNSYAMLKQVYIGELDEDKLIDGALSGFVSGAGDTYTSYLDENAMKSLSESTDGSFEGIGVEIEQSGDYIRVVSPIDHSPAFKAGLQPDDLITSVDGVDIARKNPAEVSKLVRGQRGTPVKLTIRRGSSEFTVDILRDTIPLITVSATLDKTDQTVGIVRLSSFAKTTYDELVDAIKMLREQGAKSFVIDVRSNPGGLLDSVQKIINMFVEPNQVMFQLEDKEHGVRQVRSSNVSFKVDEPVTILINNGSASAAEVFAGALSDLGRAKLVGQKSFGKGTAQTVHPLTDRTGIKVTYSKWLTPNGTWVHEKGIVPQLEVDLPSYSQLAMINTGDTYQKNDQSDAVLNIQKILSALSFDIHLTGIFDDKTVEAVKMFQESVQLEQTGIVTGDTATSLSKALKDKLRDNDTQLQKAIEVLQKSQ